MLAKSLLFGAWIFLLVPFAACSSVEAYQQMLDQAEAVRTQSPEKTVELIAELEQHYQSFNSYQQQKFTFLKAYIFAFQGKQADAITWASDVVDSQYPEIALKANLLLATVYEHRKDFRSAYTFLFSALKSGRTLNDEALQVNLYTVATQLHLSANAMDKALEYASNIVELATTPRSYCVGYALQLNAIAKLEKSYPEALLHTARQACIAAKEPLILHSITLYIAEVDLKHSPVQVKASMQSVLPELRKIGYLYSVIQAEYFLGSAELALGAYESAKTVLAQVYQQAMSLNDTQTANKAKLLLAQAYDKTGNAQAAIAAYKQHTAALNQYIDEYKQRSIAYHMAQADFMAGENKLALLKSQNELLQLESKLQKDNKQRGLLISAALLAVLLLVIYVLNSKRQALNRLATTDFLTRLFNRRYFNEAVTKQLGNRRQQGVHSLVVFDIDLFKQINDQYGHAAGDTVLSAIADYCQAQIRQQDILARMGGEEFALFLPGCSLADAKVIAEQCRQGIEQLCVATEDQIIRITASFGIAASTKADFDSLLNQADNALYQAKAAGRNCIRVYDAKDRKEGRIV